MMMTTAIMIIMAVVVLIMIDPSMMRMIRTVPSVVVMINSNDGSVDVVYLTHCCYYWNDYDNY